MRTLLRLMLLLAWIGLGRTVGWAQKAPRAAVVLRDVGDAPGQRAASRTANPLRPMARTCSVVNTADFSGRTLNEDWKTSQTLTTEGTSVTSSYNSNVTANQSSLIVQDASFGRGLTWNVDYTANGTTALSSTPNYVALTLTLNRATTGFAFGINDIDKSVGNTNGSGWTDVVQVDGYRPNGTIITLAAADIVLNANGSNTYSGSNVLTGTANSEGIDGTTTITFPEAVTKVVLTYKNGQTTYADPGAQLIRLTGFSWCAQADITTTLTGPASLAAGQVSGTYTATYTNNGPDAAAATTRTVNIPANAASAVSAPNGTVTGNQANGWTITFPAGTKVVAGTAGAVSYPFTITPAPAATSITVTSNTTTTTDEGANTAANSATLTRTVTAIADVTTSLTGPTILTTGQNSGNYTVTFANNGPSSAAGVTRTVSIPANTVASVSQTGGTLSGNSATGFTITYPGGTIASGNTVSYNFSLTPLLTNSITITSNTTTTTSQGANTAPDQATITTPVNTLADVVTTLSSNKTTAAPGESVTYTAQVQNNGPSAAANVAPTVQLPAGLLLTTANLPDGGAYDNNTGIVTLPNTASLASGTGSALTYRITFNAPNYSTTITGVAASTSNTPDPTAANNNGSQANAQVQTVVSLPSNGCAGPQYGPSRSSGLYAEYFAGYFADNLSFFDGKTAGLTRYDATLNFAATNNWGNLVPPATGSASDPNLYTARYSGSINIATAGSYTFYLNSDDASYLWLDGAALAPTIANADLKNEGAHSARERSVTLTLSAGTHNLLIIYGENTGGNVLTFSYASSTASISKQIVPNSVLCASASQPPVAQNVTNSPNLPTSYGPTAIAPLDATDPDGQVDTYTILTLPAAASGTLFLSTNGTLTAVTAGQVITAAQAGDLLFDPADGASTTNANRPTFTYLATDNSGTASNVATYIIPLKVPDVLSGRVFEDVNYGGGAGRGYNGASSSYTAASILRPGATVELYRITATDAAGRTTDGTFVTSTTTDANGTYSFNLPAAGDYAVRVVSNTVTSVRLLAVGASANDLVPVQTFVTNRVLNTNGVLGNVGDSRRVGGEAPEKQDAAANPGVANFNNRLTLAQLTTSTTVAQSVSTVLGLGGANYSNLDFGFNFDVVTNTNDAGQGSLRQFLLNSNALANTNLSQVGLAAGVETSLFMIPNGAQKNGLRAGLTNQLNANGLAVITPLSALPAITDSNTKIDGTEQTTNVGNTNTGLLGAGGTVGTNSIALDRVNAPEVQIVGTPGQAGSNFGLTVAANNTTIQGIAIYGFGNTPNAGSAANTGGGNIYVTTGATSGTLITNNVIGTSATTFTDPGAAARSVGHGIYLQAGNDNTTLFSGTISNNLIGYNSAGGIELIVNAGVNGNGTTTGYVVENNEIRGNALGNSSSDGIRLGVNGGVVRNNLFTENQGPGIDLAGSAGNAMLTNNTVSNNGLNGAGQTPGVRLQGTLNMVSQNVISNNYGAGIMALANTTRSTFSQNSIAGNGTVQTATGGAASGQIGIDLLTAADNANQGSGSFVSTNANGKTAASGANGLLNFPVIYRASTFNGNLEITGYAPQGSTIEFFLSDKTTAAFGQGQTYLFTAMEGGTVGGVTDQTARTGSYSGTVNGLNQGSETNAPIYVFSIPISSLTNLTAAQRTAITNGTVRLTATATLAQATSEFSGNVAILSNTAPLPVTLVAFGAQAAGLNAQLTWKTAQELNNDHFVVERSFDGRGFVAVGEVKGQGSTQTATSYAFTDARVANLAPAGLVYYRLRQVDADGTTALSQVKTVSFALTSRTLMEVYPNPATTQQDAQLDLSGAPAGSYQVTLADMTGRVVRSFTQNGGTVQPLQLTGLPTGTYLVRVQGNGQSFSRRVVKE